MDDGLGPALAGNIEALDIPGVKVDADYQLSVEDAAEVARHDCVVFADASVTGDGPFSFTPVAPAAEISFTSHSIPPGTVLAMARSLFGARVRAFALGIRGYHFNEFGESISEKAQQNLHAAVRFLEETIRADRFGEYTPGEAAHEESAPKKPRVVIGMTAADMN